MESLDPIVSIAVGLGLAAACGFRVFVPLLLTGVAARSGHLTLAPGFEWLASDQALLALGIATVVEAGGYFVPWLDHVLDVLAERTGLATLVLAGYSFGAMVAGLAGAKDPRVDRLVLVALPATMFDLSDLRRSPKAKLFVHGDRDQYCPIAALRDLVAGVAGQREVHEVAGADHFFSGGDDAFIAPIVRFVTA